MGCIGFAILANGCASAINVTSTLIFFIRGMTTLHKKVKKNLRGVNRTFQQQPLLAPQTHIPPLILTLILVPTIQKPWRIMRIVLRMD